MHRTEGRNTFLTAERWIRSIRREFVHDYSMYGWTEYEVGDLVSRDGTDIHVVRKVDKGGQTITVECIVAPTEDWCEIGETEFNMARRYRPISEYTDDIGDEDVCTIALRRAMFMQAYFDHMEKARERLISITRQHNAAVRGEPMCGVIPKPEVNEGVKVMNRHERRRLDAIGRAS